MGLDRWCCSRAAFSPQRRLSAYWFSGRAWDDASAPISAWIQAATSCLANIERRPHQSFTQCSRCSLCTQGLRVCDGRKGGCGYGARLGGHFVSAFPRFLMNWTGEPRFLLSSSCICVGHSSVNVAAREREDAFRRGTLREGLCLPLAALIPPSWRRFCLMIEEARTALRIAMADRLLKAFSCLRAVPLSVA